MANEPDKSRQAESKPASNNAGQMAAAFATILREKFGEFTGLTATGLVISTEHVLPDKASKSGRIWERIETTISDGKGTFTHMQMQEHSAVGSPPSLTPCPQFSTVRVQVETTNTSQGGNPEVMGPIQVV